MKKILTAVLAITLVACNNNSGMNESLSPDSAVLPQDHTTNADTGPHVDTTYKTDSINVHPDSTQ